MGFKRVSADTPLEPITWLWEGLIPRGFVSMVGALPGEGKTVLLTALAWQATRPQGELLGRAVAGAPVIYVDFDAPTGDGRAVRKWVEAHRRSYPDGDMERFILLEPDEGTFGLGEGEMEELEGMALEVGAGLIVIDSFMAAFPLDPVRLTQVQTAMWHLRRLAQRTGAAVVVIDHLPKPLAGEKTGARGLLGSVAKPAQARSVHILTRVPPAACEGRHLLRWEVLKNAFSAVPEPFGVELAFGPGGVEVREAALPEGTGNPKRDRARQAMLSLLNANPGAVILRKELLEAGIQAGNITHRTAVKYLEELIEELNLQKVALPGQGGPVGYRMPDLSIHSSAFTKQPEDPSSSQNVLCNPPFMKHSAFTKPQPEEGGDLESLHRECWTLVERLRKMDPDLGAAWAQRLNRTPLEERPRQAEELRALLARNGRREANGLSGGWGDGRTAP